MRRVSVTLPDEVFAVLEELSRGSNRSRVVADAVVGLASRRLRRGSRYAGAIVVYYDHSRGETTKALIEAQHRFLGEVRASTHIHLTRENCVDVLTVVGEGGQVERLVEDLRRVSGVITVQYALVELD